MTSEPGRSVVDCAMKCEPPYMQYCSAFAFVPESKVCLLTETQNADFSSAAPSGLVYRKSIDSDKKIVVIDGKTFQVIEHRSKGELSFARGWTQYEDGFGDETDFWIGKQN
uniref:Fibrinogen C-terminal domain-containing protein n=1 Tax=Macrostomum lignano TaxID=282301 RepID=A0A1I8JAV6_9PLAT